MADTCPECGNRVQTWAGVIYPHGSKRDGDDMPQRCPGSGLPERKHAAEQK
jgi:hypothetical protein